ncbi:MAG TPA: spore coat protein [Candidatus Atribacteria bacterium]|nr:spore coat protein [Candidatus Atribacteria bacterium]
MAQYQAISDKEIAMALLNNHKLAASALTNLVLESTNQALRQDAIQVWQKTVQHQKTLWDYLNAKGYYQVEAAPRQELVKAQQQLQQQAGQQGMQ